MVTKRGSKSCRHKVRRSRRSPDSHKQQTRRMTPMFCPLPLRSKKIGELLQIGNRGDQPLLRQDRKIFVNTLGRVL